MSRTTAPASTELTFSSEGVACRGQHLPAQTDDLASPAGRPVVVMAHGLGGTVDSGLLPFASRLAEAGLEVLAFDYRGFGASGGAPRQTVSIPRQVADYRAALAAARRLPDVDPRRAVVWGVSLAGGHVFEAAGGRDDIAAVVSLTPIVSGLAAGRLAFAHHKPTSILRSTASGIRSRIGGPVMMPLVGRPGEVAALSLDGHYEDYLALAGPTWRNEIDAAVGLELGQLRAGRAARHVTCPVLVQIADFDRSAPPHAAAKAAVRARAEVRHYPCDHFDVWPGKPWFEASVAHQARFLRRVLAPRG
jgi:fermentation-respiration switch protein FrsA (DUF1100 family)